MEQNLLLPAQSLIDHAEARLLEGYDHTLRLCAPEAVPFPNPSRIAASRHLIRHAADVPILLSALDSRPDWVLTNNVKHFTPDVAARTGLRIATPAEFSAEQPAKRATAVLRLAVSVARFAGFLL